MGRAMPENDRSDGDRSEDENDPYVGETSEEQAARLIGNSSLGTEGAQSLTDRVSEEDVAEVLRRLHERQADMDAEGEVGLDDFFDTAWDEVDYDNQLSDLIGGGADVDIPEGGTWQELADTLGKLRDGMGNAQPFDVEQFDKDVLARYEREKKAAVPPGPRTPESGGISRMAINDDAAQLGQMALDETVQGMIGAAKGHIGDAIAALAGAQQHAEQAGAQAGSLLGGSEGEAVNGQGQQVAQEISNLIGQLVSADGVADDVQGYANAFLTALRDAAAKHGGGS